MNIDELKSKLDQIGIKTTSTFKPSAQEISVYEQLLEKIAAKPQDGPLPSGVLLKKVNPDFLQPIKQI